jgi:lipopolysaccharide biosynthesis regulator YciM
VRASLLKARIDMERKDYRTAVSTLKYIKAQNPDFLTEAIELMAEAYEALGEEDHLLDYLKDILAEYPQVPVVLVLMERIRKWRGDEVATGFVADYVRSYPSLWGLELFIAMYLTKAQGRARADLLILQGLVAKLLVGKPEYACTACGHAGKELDWLCPGCKRWSSMKPIHSLEEAV